MCNLRLLIVDNLSISNDLNHLPNSLRFLDWFGYSSKCLPSSFQPQELVELNLQFSEIKYLWEGVKVIFFFSQHIYTFFFSLGVASINFLTLQILLFY